MARLINKLGGKRKSTTTCHLSKRKGHLIQIHEYQEPSPRLGELFHPLKLHMHTHTIFPWADALFEHLNCCILLYRNVQSFLHQQSSIVRVTELQWGSKALDYSCVTAVSLWGDCRIALIMPVSSDRRTSPGFGDCRAHTEGRQSLWAGVRHSLLWSGHAQAPGGAVSSRLGVWKILLTWEGATEWRDGGSGAELCLGSPSWLWTESFGKLKTQQTHKGDSLKQHLSLMPSLHTQIRLITASPALCSIPRKTAGKLFLHNCAKQQGNPQGHKLAGKD